MIDFQRSGFGVHLQDFVVFIYSDDYQINFNILHQFTDIYSSKIWVNLDIWAQNLSNLRPNIKREKKKLMTKLINRRFPILYTINLTKVDGEATKWSTTRRAIEDDHVQGFLILRKRKQKHFRFW